MTGFFPLKSILSRRLDSAEASVKFINSIESYTVKIYQKVISFIEQFNSEFDRHFLANGLKPIPNVPLNFEWNVLR